ncbi:unnamed protein product [Caenorhabditis brenneri]
MRAVKNELDRKMDNLLDRLSEGNGYLARLKKDVESLDPPLNFVKESADLLAAWIPLIETGAKQMKIKSMTARSTTALASDCKLLLNDIKLVNDSHETIAKEISKLSVGDFPKYLPVTLDSTKRTISKIHETAVQILELLEGKPIDNENKLFKFSTELEEKEQLEKKKARDAQRAVVQKEMNNDKQLKKETTMVETSILKASKIYGLEQDYEKLILLLSKYEPRSPEFIELLAQVQSNLCSTICKNVIEIETEQDYNQLTDDILRNNGCIIRGLLDKVGLKVPDVTFENLGSFDGDKKHKFIDSMNGTPIEKTFKYFLEQIRRRNEGEPHIILNLLSHEITGSGHDFKLPRLLLQKSVICQIESSTNLSKEDLELKNSFLETITHMTRYLIVSMKHAFTDMHVDPAGSSVYYHVIKGKKVVWMAPPTEENLSLYERFEKEKKDNVLWNVAKCLHEFQRVEIREGNTLLIPPAWPHFVYTPTDTIVVGGNYLKLKDVDLHFKVVQIEKATNAPKKETFPFFWETLYAYTRLVFIPKLEKAKTNATLTEEDRRTARLLHSELSQVEHLENNYNEKQPKVWFDREIRDQTVESLKDFIIPEPQQMKTGGRSSNGQKSSK